MKTILITGGTGFIGEELRERLLQQGDNVIVVTRSPKKYEDVAASNQQFVSWGEDLVKAMNRTDVVINLAGENVFGKRWTEAVKKSIYDSRIDSTRKLVEAMAAAEKKPEVFISASASGYYGSQGDKVLDEEQPSADDFLAQVCIDWEAEALKAEELGVRVALARIGIVLEEGGGVMDKMLPPFRFFVGGPIGDGKQYMSWIHRSDLCAALLFPIDTPGLSGPYNVCAPEPATMNDFSETLGNVLNRPSFFRVPKFALDLAFGEAAQPITASTRMQPKKLQVNGFEFHFESLEEALADIAN